jgi:hypothetical protein
MSTDGRLEWAKIIIFDFIYLPSFVIEITGIFPVSLFRGAPYQVGCQKFPEQLFT